jgi:hypothetical protein
MWVYWVLRVHLHCVGDSCSILVKLYRGVSGDCRAAAAAAAAAAAGAFGAAARRRLATLTDAISSFVFGLPSFFTLRGLLAFSCRFVAAQVEFEKGTF